MKLSQSTALVLAAMIPLLAAAGCSDTETPPAAAEAAQPAASEDVAVAAAPGESGETVPSTEETTQAIPVQDIEPKGFNGRIAGIAEGLATESDVASAEPAISEAVKAGPQSETLEFLNAGYKNLNQDIAPALHHAVAKSAFETYRTPAAAGQYAADKIVGFGTPKDLEGAMSVLTTAEIADNPAVLMQRASILLDEAYDGANRDEAIALLKRAAEGGVQAATTKLTELGVTM